MLKKIQKLIQNPIEDVFGKFSSHQLHNKTLKNLPDIETSLNNIKNRWDINKSGEEKPIFILSAGWRSGSTLLQRLVTSSEKKILIWGEPYSHSDYVRKLADSLKIFLGENPPNSFFIDSYVDKKQNIKINQWIACLYPNPEELWRAHKAFMITLFEEPAKKLGYNSWGIKEVKWDIDYVRYLKWLFPESKFIFLYRNPFEAYRSYKTFGKWYDKWPNDPVFTARKFGLLWKKLLSGYIKEYDALGGFLLKYENLISEESTLRQLESFLGFPLDDSILSNKVSGRVSEKPKISWIERKILTKTVNPLATDLGY